MASDEPKPYRRGSSQVTTKGYRKGVSPPNAGKTYPFERLTREEVRAILEQCDGTPAQLRYLVFFVLLYRTGAKPGELFALRLSDFDRERRELTVGNHRPEGRSARSRERDLTPRKIGLDRETFELVEQWLAVRAERGAIGDILFCSIEGDGKGWQMSAPLLRTRLKQFKKRAGITKEVQLMTFRNTLIAELVEERYALNVIQTQCGFKTLAATERHLKHLKLPVDATVELMKVRRWESPPPTRGIARPQTSLL